MELMSNLLRQQIIIDSAQGPPSSHITVFEALIKRYSELVEFGAISQFKNKLKLVMLKMSMLTFWRDAMQTRDI